MWQTTPNDCLESLILFHAASHLWQTPNRLFCNTGLFCTTAVLIDFCKKHDWHDERGFSLSSRCWGLQLMTFFLERIIRVQISMFLVIFSIVLAMFAVEVATSNRGLGLAMFCLSLAARYIQHKMQQPTSSSLVYSSLVSTSSRNELAS